MSVTHEECPLCMHPAAPLPLRERRAFFHCPNCDLVFVARDCHPTFDAAAARYRLHENTLDNAGYVARFEHFIDRIKQYAPPPAAVLDYGCGPAPVLVELLRRRGYDARGYDRHFTDAWASRGRFELIVSTETFEHFTRPGADVARMIRRLRPGGVLAVMTLLHGGAGTIDGWWYARDPTHVAFYSQKTFAFLAARHRLTPLENNARDTLIFRRGRG